MKETSSHSSEATKNSNAEQLAEIRSIIFENLKSIIELLKDGIISGSISSDINLMTTTPVVSNDAVVIRRYKKIYIDNDTVVADIELLNSKDFISDGTQRVILEDKCVPLKNQFDIAQFLYDFSFMQQIK